MAHILARSVELDLPREEVFAFFANAENLEQITPPELGFHILSGRPIVLREGALTDYKLRLRGIPMKWRMEISVWEPPYKFVDKQIRGPYTQWIHTHTFTEIGDNKTRIDDEVLYRLPFGALGDVFHFLVKRELNYIFEFRQKAVRQILQSRGIHVPENA